jgi:hypothetical protein
MMRFIECRQGTPEWHLERSGLITASCFADAISTVGAMNDQQLAYVAAVRAGKPEKEAALDAGYKSAPKSEIIKRALAGEDTSQPSDTAKRYAADLALERISGMQLCEPPRAWVLDRGHEMEDIARRLYEGRNRAYVTEAGICVDGMFGYSTDGLVDDDGLIEIKAPVDSVKIETMWKTGDVSEYLHQMQGGIWLTGRKWCDFIMYVPALVSVGKDMYVKRILRDDAFIDDMVDKLVKFETMVLQAEQFWRAG